ncbi:MAG TPA: aspartate 1-decarboxylase [Bacteroidota bacterium]|jgi:aspartate 1-decarboxylase|nr:aspartate 1-decarboxylase [Bacteroidota bacterium]
MKRIMFKSKIHRARVTQAELYYEGSITIDSTLMDQADILEYEKVQVVNINNGNRFETYALRGEAGSGIICLNGAAARLGHVGDQVIIITYAEFDAAELEGFKPTIVLVDETNSVKTIL